MIIGHKLQVERLMADFEEGNLSHAYLLVGERGVGKRTVCENMAKGWMGETFMVDFLAFLDEGESFKIKEVRGLIEKVSVSKQGKVRVVLIENIERMTLAAANSMLKILEEPPDGTVFMLTTSDFSRILSTIVSRVRVMRFGICDAEEMKRITSDSEVLMFAQGRPGLAKRLVEDLEFFGAYKEMWEEINVMMKERSVVARFKFVEEVKNEKLFLDLLLLKCREGLFEGVNRTNELSKIIEAGMLIEKNVNKRLVLENLMLKI